MVNKKVVKLAGLVVVAGSLVGGGYAVGQKSNASYMLESQYNTALNRLDTLAAYKATYKMKGDAAAKAELMQKMKPLMESPGELASIVKGGLTNAQFANDRIGERYLKYRTGLIGADTEEQALMAAGDSTIDLLFLQTTQNQKVIEQNQKIIELLTELKNKK
jgi:predicted exporter